MGVARTAREVLSSGTTRPSFAFALAVLCGSVLSCAHVAKVEPLYPIAQGSALRDGRCTLAVDDRAFYSRRVEAGSPCSSWDRFSIDRGAGQALVSASEQVLSRFCEEVAVSGRPAEAPSQGGQSPTAAEVRVV